jgi:hypothetical protein
MEVRVQVAMPDHVAGDLVPVSGAPHRFDGVTGLRADRNRVDPR